MANLLPVIKTLLGVSAVSALIVGLAGLLIGLLILLFAKVHGGGDLLLAWIGCFLLVSFALYGAIKMSHNSIEEWRRSRK